MFCNPPYGRQINEWVRKGYEESKKPGTLVVMLIPARTDTSYFHDYIFHGKADEVRFIRGRLTFTDEDGNPTKDAKGRPCSAPFPSAVVIWHSKDMAQSLRDMVLDLIKDRDMTANEIAATLSDRGQQISRSDVGPILTKAQAAGLIRNAGKRECSVTGRSLRSTHCCPTLNMAGNTIRSLSSYLCRRVSLPARNGRTSRRWRAIS